MSASAHHRAASAPARNRAPRFAPAAPRAMSELARERVFGLIRTHLADELDVDPDVIVEETRFKEDLEADSLDLYTLVQELEDTYGVKISDEQAAQILTVGQTVEFVLAHGTADAAR